MKFEHQLNEHYLIEQFLEMLRALPEVHAELDNCDLTDDVGHDAAINLHVSGKIFCLLVVAKKNVYPRDVRQAIWQSMENKSKIQKEYRTVNVLPVLLAESISPGAKELLVAESFGYYDSGGSLFLPAHGAYFYIDRPPPKKLTKSLRSLFSGRRAQVLHTLLVFNQNWFGVKDIAEKAQVSPATASQVLTELERLEWMDSRGQGPSKERRLVEPTALLDGWSKQFISAQAPILRRYYVPSIKSNNLLEYIGHVFALHEVGYAISHEAAAQCYSPFLSSVSQVRCRMLVGAAAFAAISELNARVVTEGANLLIIESKSPSDLLFREQVDGIWLASPIQVYLDLLRSEGRSKELAEHLRRERIGF